MRIDDQVLERIVANLLRTGVFLSALVVLAGGICFLSQHGHQPAGLREFRGEPATYRTVPGVLQATAHGDCRAVIQLGLLLLIATPVARVALAMAGFAAEHDRAYVIISAIVLVVLLFGIIEGQARG